MGLSGIVGLREVSEKFVIVELAVPDLHFPWEVMEVEDGGHGRVRAALILRNSKERRT